MFIINNFYLQKITKILLFTSIILATIGFIVYIYGIYLINKNKILG
jgi:hypothetical protein